MVKALSRLPGWTVDYSLKDRTMEHLRSGEDALDAIRIFINPISIGFFPGKVDPDLMSPADKAVIRLGSVTPGDFREDDLVKSWAKTLAGSLSEEVR